MRSCASACTCTHAREAWQVERLDARAIPRRGVGWYATAMFTSPEADALQAETLRIYRDRVAELERTYRDMKAAAYQEYLAGLQRAAGMRQEGRLEASAQSRTTKGASGA